MPDPVRWGPDKTHPFSRMRTELVWDGKYDEYGRRRSVDVAGAAMPMQKIAPRTTKAIHAGRCLTLVRAGSPEAVALPVAWEPRVSDTPPRYR